ncbi:hypothetical protein F441_05582 [Phytophthora nicotianae CJ01A1]|uniref:Uncharacterized protein n=1 Tax=Phytophthora nicotianae CJ01A1 TaxID=1317063 RepID=W2XE64_PHYNI|nr:hypothetical protein F441_05582 [Phytophthora nicotianae CJ01A1]
MMTWITVWPLVEKWLSVQTLRQGWPRFNEEPKKRCLYRRGMRSLVYCAHRLGNLTNGEIPASRSKRKRTAEELDQAIAKKARNRGSKYIEANWIPETSVVAERFFSMVKAP